MEQVVSFASALPIKKRRFPVTESASPSAEEIPSISADIKQDSSIRGDAAEISDLSKSSALEVPDMRVDNSESTLQKPEPTTSVRYVAELDNEVYISPAEEPAEQDILTNSVGAGAMIIKQELVSGQTTGTHGLELSAGSQIAELPLEPKDPVVSALDHPIRAAICGKLDESGSSLLSLGVSNVNLDLPDNNAITVENSSSRAYANRSNWDLNTNMDEWEGSVTNGTFSQRPIGIGGLSKTSDGHGLESSSGNLDVKTADDKVILGLDKGKHTMNEYSSNSSNRSVLSMQCKGGDSLGLSLAMMPFREVGTSGKHYFLSEKLDSTDVGPKLNLQKIQSSSKIMNLASSRTVKLEPVAEDSMSDSRIDFGSSISMGSSMFSSKTQIVEKKKSALLLMSSLSLKESVDRRSIKSEPIQERHNDVRMVENSTRPQHFGRVMQHQESTASSSGLSMPLTPQNSCPSRLSTESNISRNQSQNSLRRGEVLCQQDIPHEQIAATVSKSLIQDGKQSMLCDAGNLNAEDPEKLEQTRVDRHPLDLHGNSQIVANGEEKINLSTEMLEEKAFGSDCEFYENRGAATPMVEGEKPCNKEDGEYEEGEVRTPLQQSAGAYPVVDEKKTVNVELFEYGSRNLMPLVLLGDQSTITSDYDGKSAISKIHDEPHNDHIKEFLIVGYDPNSGENSSQKLSDNVPEAGVDEKRSVNDTIEKRLDLSRQQDVRKDTGEGVSTEGPANASHATVTGLVDKEATFMVEKFCLGKHDSTFPMMEASINGSDAAKDSSNAGNKSRIITLPRASAAPSPSCITRSIPNRLLTPRSGKGRYPDLDGDMQSRGNRNDFYASGPNFFTKDRVHDLSLGNSRPSFMRGKGRGAGRFGPLHNEWGTDNDFASETYNGQSDYRARRHKQHASSVDDVEFVYNNGYGAGPDGTAMFSGRRKAMNDDKFIRHSSDDISDPVYSRPLVSYEEFDGQLMRGNRNFSTMRRKVYPRVQSKSPVRSRTRSPGPWSSRRRRSPDGRPEINQHRSAPLYRMKKMRSPDRACFRDEMVSRRRESPSYVTRHSSDLRDADSVPDHGHPRPVNSNGRSPQTRDFPRTARRELLNPRERGDESVDEGRKFIERQGPFHSFRPSFNEANDNFHFQVNDCSRSFRFCPDADTQFVERSNMREREFHGHIKHQPSIESRRPRDIEGRPRDIEDQDGNYRPGGRVWHDDGFSDISGLKRRRF